MRKIKDYFFASFAFPLAFDVAILFWSLFLIDRQTVFPEEVDEFFPSWLNHILHTNVAVFIAIELLILHREYPTRTRGVTGLMSFMLSYLIWMCVTRYFAGRWAYPILDILSVPLKIGFFAFTILIFPIAMYFLGEWLNIKFWTIRKLKNGRI